MRVPADFLHQLLFLLLLLLLLPCLFYAIHTKYICRDWVSWFCLLDQVNFLVKILWQVFQKWSNFQKILISATNYLHYFLIFWDSYLSSCYFSFYVFFPYFFFYLLSDQSLDHCGPFWLPKHCKLCQWVTWRLLAGVEVSKTLVAVFISTCEPVSPRPVPPPALLSGGPVRDSLAVLRVDTPAPGLPVAAWTIPAQLPHLHHSLLDTCMGEITSGALLTEVTCCFTPSFVVDLKLHCGQCFSKTFSAGELLDPPCSFKSFSIWTCCILHPTCSQSPSHLKSMIHSSTLSSILYFSNVATFSRVISFCYCIFINSSNMLFFSNISSLYSDLYPLNFLVLWAFSSCASASDLSPPPKKLNQDINKKQKRLLKTKHVEVA